MEFGLMRIQMIYRHSRFVIIGLGILAIIGLTAFQFFFVSVKAQETELAPNAVVFSENFDALTTPNLPAGWTSTNTGGSVPFATLSTFPDSPPNAIYTNDPFIVGTSSLTTPAIALGNVRHKLIFRQRYQLDYEFDGGVLEISANGGTFTDIISAGGSFVSGGYTTPLVASDLAGRNAWTGDSITYISTEINLPANTSNSSIRLRWRFACDDMEGGDGWRIDSVQIINAISGFNSNSIAIPASGAASVYPSEIQVSGQQGLVSAVQVNLTNFSHTSPDDVDLMLVAPNGHRVVLMSDVGGINPVTNLNLIFDDIATASLPDSSVITSGTYRPTDFDLGDIYPNPAPNATQSGRLLASLNGLSPNGAWSLFLVDDTGANAGSISGGWNISVVSSPDVIGLQNTGAATPYPSQRTFFGRLGTVTKVIVSIANFSHTSPDDVDLMLVAPNGRRVVLMSDVGGNTEVGGLNLTFDDAATANLPDSGTLTSGTFKPTDFEIGDVFPTPAPQVGTSGSTLAEFFGSAPNGTWRLFAVDDLGNNVGSIAGNWNLSLTTSATACNFTINPSTQTFATTGGNGTFSINMPSNCSWAVASRSDFLTINSNLSGNGNGTIDFSVPQNFGGARSGSIVVSNGVTTRTFQVQQPSGCPVSISQTAVNFTASGGTGSVSVAAGGVCSYLATNSASWIQITSPTQSGNGSVTFNVSSNPTSNSRSANVFVGGQSFSVNQAGSAGRRFDFDGDGKADLSIFRPSTAIWWRLNSGLAGSFSATQFGIAADKLTPADYDGDRKTDISVYRNGIWYAILSQTNTLRVDSWGLATDIPVPHDYDGDGKADVAVYRGSEGTWYVSRSSNGAFQVAVYGLSTDKPVPADYDGDGKADFALFRTGAVGSEARWLVLNSGNSSSTSTQFGVSGDIAVPADYDGDGRDNFAIFRPSTGFWYTSLNPATNYGGVQFGMMGDIPVPADYDGDSKADVSIFRQGIWYRIDSSNQAFRSNSWGSANDLAIPGSFNRQ
jgi:subtilisin-like proprotein convertase family protein